MSHIEILLPFGLPSPNDGGVSLHPRDMPALARCVSRHREILRQADFDTHARALPHEAWLAAQLGLTENPDPANSPPFASVSMYLHGVGQQKGFWFILHPAHIQVYPDRMVLQDRRRIRLAEADSRALFNAAQPAFEQAGKTVVYGNETTWFLRADDWQNLVTATPDMACGRHLAHWMPEGPQEPAWRKLLNDVQMIWHDHPVNRARQEKGEEKINALWLWAGSTATLPTFPAILPYTKAYRFAGRMEAFGQFFDECEQDCTADTTLAHPPEHGLLLVDELIAPALAGDWHAWRTAYETVEDVWLAPLLEGLMQRKIDRLTLNMSHDTSLKTFVIDRAAQRKFWVRQSLLPLLR